MRIIVPSIPTLNQYLILQKEEPERFRPAVCPYCGKAGLWHHGHYDRKQTVLTVTKIQLIFPDSFVQTAIELVLYCQSVYLPRDGICGISSKQL